MWILPLILEEDDVRYVPREYLDRLAACSTDVILDAVRKYLSNDEADKDIKLIVSDIYRKYIEQDDYIKSCAVKDIAEKLNNLTYMSISPSMPMEDLVNYKNIIKTTLNNQYAVPYKVPIDPKLIRSLLQDLKDYVSVSKSYKVKAFRDRLDMHKIYFKDEQNASARGTPLKKIMRNRLEYEIILHGIEFVIDKKNSGTKPVSWRRL